MKQSPDCPHLFLNVSESNITKLNYKNNFRGEKKSIEKTIPHVIFFYIYMALQSYLREDFMNRRNAQYLNLLLLLFFFVCLFFVGGGGVEGRSIKENIFGIFYKGMG